MSIYFSNGWNSIFFFFFHYFLKSEFPSLKFLFLLFGKLKCLNQIIILVKILLFQKVALLLINISAI